MSLCKREISLSIATTVAVLLLGVGVANAQIPVQIVNSSPDPAAAVVDVYVDGTRVADDLAYKTATPFVDGGGNPVIIVTPTSTVAVVDGAAVDDSSPLVSETLALTAGAPTLLEILGLVNPGGFDPNPDGRSTALDIVPYEGYKPAADDPLTAELLAVHAAPDVGAVDLIVRTTHDQPGQGIPLFTNLQYGDILPYVVIQPSVATLDLVESGTTNLVETWVATFGLVVGAGVVGHAAGLQNPPTVDQGLALFGVVASGFVFELEEGSETAVGDAVPGARAFELGSNYPNPFNPKTTIPFTLHTRQSVKLDVYDMKGRRVDTLVDGVLEADDYQIPFQPRALASGPYLYRLETASGTQTGTMTLVK